VKRAAKKCTTLDANGAFCDQKTHPYEETTQSQKFQVPLGKSACGKPSTEKKTMGSALLRMTRERVAAFYAHTELSQPSMRANTRETSRNAMDSPFTRAM